MWNKASSAFALPFFGFPVLPTITYSFLEHLILALALVYAQIAALSCWFSTLSLSVVGDLPSFPMGHTLLESLFISLPFYLCSPSTFQIKLPSKVGENPSPSTTCQINDRIRLG
jgi:hypothetical protein